MTYFFRVKLIRSECSKRWPGNTKVYFKGNEKNSLILSEMVLLIEPQAAIEEIGFGREEEEEKKRLDQVTCLAITLD